MKTPKKLLSLLLAAAMLFSLAIPAFAAEKNDAAYLVTDVATLKAGDKIIVFNPASGLALSSENATDTAVKGVKVTPADGVISNPDASILWTTDKDMFEANMICLAQGDKKCVLTSSVEDGKMTVTGLNIIENSNPEFGYYHWYAAPQGASDGLYYINNVPTTSMLLAVKNGVFTSVSGKNADSSCIMQIYRLGAAEEADDMTGKTVILHSNDVHGSIAGYANMAALKTDFESRGADVILADAGDYSQGTTYVSTSKGGSAIAMMNAAGYDVATIGNHEFDYGWEQLKENAAKASFKVLCADVLENGEPIFDGHTVIEKGGVKIGFFGMETPEAQTKANPALIKGLTFLAKAEMFACAQAEVNALKAEGADIIICLAHLGLDDESMGNRSVDMLGAVTGIDMVIDGHSHTVITASADKPIQSTGTAFANIGVIVIDNKTKAIADNYLVPVTKDFAKDGAVAAAAQDIMNAIDEQYGAVFAKSEVTLNGTKAPNGNRDSETNLGDLIADAMLWQVMQNKDGLLVDDDHVVAITNGGGIRETIEVGDVTMNNVHTVLPFGNTVAVVYVKGSELLEALEASTYCTPNAVGGFPQVAGIDMTITVCEKYDAKRETYPASTYYGPASINRVAINSINGKDFEPDAVYAVVSNDFCTAGGDTYYAFAAATAKFDTGVPMDEALINYITEALNGVVGKQYANPQGRIIIKGHQWSEWEAIIPGCVYGGGVNMRICTICGERETLPVSTPGDHSKDPFNDIAASGYHDYIIHASYNGIVKGYDDGTFRPKDPVTRAQFITMLWRASGEPTAEKTALTFADAGMISAPYRAAVAWGVEQGIIKGYGNNTFRPNVNITRAQLATFLCRYAEGEMGTMPESYSQPFGFADEASFDANYARSINVIANIGIMNGVGGNLFNSAGTANRGMAATVLYRLLEWEYQDIPIA